MRRFLLIISLIALAIIVPFLLPDLSRPAGQTPERNLPWQITLDGQGGSTVFGLQPGRSTLADVRQALGQEIDVAIIAAPEETGALEGYYAQLPLGFVLARVIVTLEADAQELQAMRERAIQSKYMESATRKISLNPEDLARAEQRIVRAISVIPSSSLDEASLTGRFGPPAERVPVGDTLVHLLYPALGLDIVVDSKGKEILQYVAPRDFERLRTPLQAEKPAT